MNNGNGNLESLRHELDRLIDIHSSEIDRLGLLFEHGAIRKLRDTWVVPVSVGDSTGDAGDVNDLLRVIRRSLQAKTHDPVSVLIEANEE